jgi:hypothetical protein
MASLYHSLGRTPFADGGAEKPRTRDTRAVETLDDDHVGGELLARHRASTRQSVTVETLDEDHAGGLLLSFASKNTRVTATIETIDDDHSGAILLTALPSAAD